MFAASRCSWPFLWGGHVCGQCYVQVLFQAFRKDCQPPKMKLWVFGVSFPWLWTKSLQLQHVDTQGCPEGIMSLSQSYEKYVCSHEMSMSLSQVQGKFGLGTTASRNSSRCSLGLRRMDQWIGSRPCQGCIGGFFQAHESAHESLELLTVGKQPKGAVVATLCVSIAPRKR